MAAVSWEPIIDGKVGLKFTREETFVLYYQLGVVDNRIVYRLSKNLFKIAQHQDLFFHAIKCIKI